MPQADGRYYTRDFCYQSLNLGRRREDCCRGPCHQRSCRTAGRRPGCTGSTRIPFASVPLRQPVRPHCCLHGAQHMGTNGFCVLKPVAPTFRVSFLLPSPLSSELQLQAPEKKLQANKWKGAILGDLTIHFHYRHKQNALKRAIFTLLL